MTWKTKFAIGLGLLTSLIVMMILPGWDGFGLSVAHAQAAAGSGTMLPFTFTGTFVDFTKQITSFLITIINSIIWFLFMFLDQVLDPIWIFDLEGGPGLTNMLREIWQLCRDLVNLGLALGLIAGAIVMIVKSDATMIKTALPKFVMAVVLVNFSWFLPRAVFDAAQILTYTVYQIPSLLDNTGCVLPPTATEPSRPCDVVVDYAFFDQTQLIDLNGVLRANNGQPLTTGWTCILRPLVCIRKVSIGSPEATVNAHMHSGVLNGLIVNHARLQSLIQISDPRAGGIGPLPGGPVEQSLGLIAEVIKLVIILLFHVAIFFPLLALVAAFFMRIPVLWVTMAFMPLTALGYVFGDSVFGEMNPKKLFMEQFINAVFLPAKVAVPFTIGFIMVNAGAQTSPPGVFNSIQPIAVFSSVSSLWQMMWMIISIYIVWKYSFESLKSGGETVNFFTEGIKGFGQNAFKLAQQGLLNVPIIPIPNAKDGAKASVADLGFALNPQTGLNQIRAGGSLQLWPEVLRQRAEQRKQQSGQRLSTEGNKAAKLIMEMPAIHGEVRVHVETAFKTAAANPANPAAMDESLKKIAEALTRSGKFKGMSELEAMEGTLLGLGFTPEQRERIIKRLRENGGATRIIPGA